ncbi:MAG: phospholipase D-like domain-containing protein [Actinobacteria bacterium]|nr:phospholipase D-like domain-containing protein [Actinomycetota bacterium]
MAPGGFLIFAMGMGKALGSQLHGAMTRVSDAPLRGGNELGLLENGPATYEDWLAVIEDARRWVHLENYIFRADGIGRRFANVLCAKVREGVPVRVLYDWFGSWDVPRSFWEELRWAGVEVRAVNPLTLQEPLDFLRRDHRKLLAVDGVYASAGGVCIGDEWLRRSPETGLPYRDTAVSVRGPAVADLERAFAGVWDQSGPPLPNGERPAAGDIPPVGGQEVRVVIQEPGKARVLRILELLMAEVQERMWIADAYFLSIPTLTQSLMAAARDGVDVRILLPATNDLPWIGVLSRIGYQQLLEAGVRIYEYGGLMMHAKTSITDGLWGRVGSTNLNVSGLLANWEVDILAEDRSFPGSGPRVVATASRVGNAVGNAVLTASGGDPLNTHERAIGAALAAGAIGVSALGVRYPRLLAWPLAGAGGFAGSLGLLHVAQRAWSERNAKGTNRGR